MTALHMFVVYLAQHQIICRNVQKTKLVDRFVALGAFDVALAEVFQHAGGAEYMATSCIHRVDKPIRADRTSQHADIVLSALLEVAYLAEAVGVEEEKKKKTEINIELIQSLPFPFETVQL